MASEPPAKIAPPPHCQLRSILSNIQHVKENLHLSVAAMATYASEGNVERVIALSKSLRNAVIAKDFCAIESKIEASIAQVNSTHRKFIQEQKENLELKSQIKTLQLQIKKLEYEELSFTQAGDLVDANEDTVVVPQVVE